MLIETFPYSYHILLVIASIWLLYVIIKRGTAPIIWHHHGNYYETPRGYFAFPKLDEDPTLCLSVIIPTYNEEYRLPGMLNEAIEFFEFRQSMKGRCTFEIIVVDDGSKDRTAEVAMEYSYEYGTDKVRVLQLPKNHGKGCAVRRGMLSGRGRFLLLVDADGAARFSDIERLQARMRDINIQPDKRAIILGSRPSAEEDAIASTSTFNAVIMKIFYWLVWFLCAKNFKNTQCGVKLFTRSAAQIVFNNMHVERWGYNIELLFIAESLDIPLGEVPVSWSDGSGFKVVPLFSWLQMIKDVITIWLYHRLRIWKIKKEMD